ncbi:uncharacterized protein LOC134834074 [Culicoides brevitarsis]|uniref:uncharacterized protein LOC134834074 n=1 Tax=Culicoides brevitarsis TaxID=469753 RepID=UPI00307C7118
MESKRTKMETSCFDLLPVELQQIIFGHCHPKQRREIALVCTNWAETLQSFAEDYQLHLHDCYLHRDIEPVSLFFNSRRKYRYLKLGENITSHHQLLTTAFLSHLGENVQCLDVSQAMKLINASEFHLMFPQLRKLTIRKLGDLYENCPETLEHVHVQQLSIMEKTEDMERLRKIKNLKFLTAERVQIKGGLDALVLIAAQFATISTKIFSLDEKLKEYLESVQSLENVYFKCTTNFINNPTILFEEVTELYFKRPPSSYNNLNLFPNLKVLHILWDRDIASLSSCFFMHEKIICPTVEELKMENIKERNCMACFRFMIDCFPNLKSLYLLNTVFGNDNFKHICFKLPQLKKLELESNELEPLNLVTNDQPEYLLSNLTQLESLSLPLIDVTFMLAQWPRMEKLKKVVFGSTIQFHPKFAINTPNLEYFGISYNGGTGLRLSTTNMPNLRVLKANCDLSMEESCRSIIENCQKLQIFETCTPNAKFIHELNLFEKISSLRKIVNDEREFTRRDFINLENYVKRHYIEYEDLGEYKSKVAPYTLDELSDQEDSDDIGRSFAF